METKDGIAAFHARSTQEWREWLEKNGAAATAIWLIIYHKKSSTPAVSYQAAIEQALCYGWIDSKAIRRDEESFYLLFTHRKPRSNWSKPNRERVDKMIAAGMMTPAGQALIDLAKKTGTWNKLADAQHNVMPDDLQKMLQKNKTALKNFEAFSPSSKRHIYAWITTAKKETTRQQRLILTVDLAAVNVKANHH